MKLDDDYLRTLYNTKSFDEFLDIVNTDNLSNPRTTAILTALIRSRQVLNIHLNPIVTTTEPLQKREEHTGPHEY
jgi:hypothetical protein